MTIAAAIILLLALVIVDTIGYIGMLSGRRQLIKTHIGLGALLILGLAGSCYLLMKGSEPLYIFPIIALVYALISLRGVLGKVSLLVSVSDT